MVKQNPAQSTIWSMDHLVPADVDSATNALKVYLVNGGSGGTSASYNTTFPSVGTPVGGLDSSNGNFVPINIDHATGGLIVSGTVSATNPSVGTVTAAVPASGTAIGWKDGSGNLQLVAAATPLPVSGTFSAGEATIDITGSVSSAATICTQADTTGYYSAFFQIGGIGTSTVIAEINNTGTWVTTNVAPVSTWISQTSVTANGMYVAHTGGLGFRLRVSSYDGSATVTANCFFRGFPIEIIPATVAVTASQATAANLNATVVGTGTFATQATQSGTWNITNVSGTVSLPTGASTSAKQPALGTAGTASIDVLTIQGIASMTKLLVTPDSVALPANQSVNVAQVNGVTTLAGTGAVGTGSIRVAVGTDTATIAGSATLPAGTNLAADVGLQLRATNGLTTSYTSCANSNNATSVKASAGSIAHIRAFNNSATIAYLKLYNKASAPTPASDTVVDKILIPANTSGAGVVLDIAYGQTFSTGIAFAVVTGFGDTDNTSVAANAYSVTILYK